MLLIKTLGLLAILESTHCQVILTIVEIKFVKFQSFDQVSECLRFECRQMWVTKAPKSRIVLKIRFAEVPKGSSTRDQIKQECAFQSKNLRQHSAAVICR